MQKVPFVDLYAQYLTIKADIDIAIEDTIRQSSYIGGAAISRFEQQFAAFTGMPNVVACANGTDSIEIILKALQIGVDDEVIVPAISWISTSEAVSAVGACPVFVDIEEDFCTIDPSLIERAITPKTKAIIPVHLYGHPADMPAIMEIARNHKLLVIEDCAQSHGSMINGRLAGSFGDAASYSFYPGKNLGAYGDAGAMVIKDPKVADIARMIANHGQKGKHNHIIEGRNSRLDGLQAAILNAKLPHLNKWTEARIENSIYYTELLKDVAGLEVPKVREEYKHVFHLYVIRTRSREALQYALMSAGIDSAIHYPTALPFLPCYKGFGYSFNDFPIALKVQSEILSIPMYAELTKEQILYVAKHIKANS